MALATLATVVVVAVVWTQSRGQSDPGPAERPPTPAPLWSVESAAVRRLVVEDGQGAVLLAAARGGETGWVLQAPQSAPADAGRLERAVSWLISPPVRAELDLQADLAPFELDPPRYRVRLETADSAERSFAIGRVAPTGDTVYVLMPGRPGIVLLSDYGVAEVLSLLDPLPVVPQGTAVQTEATASP
ncbi:MAG: DUF4340 domain-containing protein [Anaerolineales bacterium]|nr:DUF4340 domain-containing protein [Anaerolineales bacterium]